MSETLSETKLRLETFITEQYPDVDLAPGSALSELLIKLATTLQNPIKNDLDALAQTNSVTNALESIEDTYSEVVDNIASNYGVYRSSGNKSVGSLKITVTGDDTRYLETGFTFYQPILKLNYRTTSSYRATLTPSDPNDVQLVRINSSLYYFIVPVEAAEVGTAYKLNDQTSLSIAEGYTLFNFVDARAYGNFSNGLNQETDKELITRFKTGLTHKTLLSRDSIFNRVKELYPGLRDISLVTANDAEMTRSKQNVFGISTLGMVDVYAKTTFGLETITILAQGTKTATGEWEIELDQAAAPGFYRVISVLPHESGHSGSLEFTATFDYDTSAFKIANTLNNKYEARFTKYQTVSLAVAFNEDLFDDRSVQVPIGTQEFFEVLVAYQPNIKDLQDLLLNSNERILCADYLVKAALPCFVTINLSLVRKDKSREFPVDKLKQAIFEHVNSLSFGESLHASNIIDICHNFGVKNVNLPIKMTGEIFTDHSTLIRVESTDVLEIPTKLAMGVSSKTTTFVSNYFNQGFDPGANITDAIGIEVI